MNISFLSLSSIFYQPIQSPAASPQSLSGISSPEDEGSKVLILDFDEAVDSFAKLYGTVKEIFQTGSFDGIVQELKNKAEHLARKPWEYLAINPPESLFAQFALGAVLSASTIAFYGSWHSRWAATNKHQELSKQKEELDTKIQLWNQSLQNEEIKDASPSPIVAFIKKEQTCQQQMLNTLERAIEMNNLDKRISQAALAMSSATLVRALIELIARSALTGPLALAVIVPALVSKLLELFGASNAVLMGKNLVKKSEEFQQSRVATVNAQILTHIDECINNTQRTEDATVTVEKKLLDSYVDSIRTALTQQQQFANAFHHWNLGYFIGSIIYAMSVITNSLLIIASLAGAAALASYPMMGALFVMSTIGSLTMAVCTKQFFFDYEKQKDYDSSETEPDAELDRDFLISVGIQQDKQAGLALRAAFSDQVHQREKLRKALCDQAQKELKGPLKFIGLLQSSLKNWLEQEQNYAAQIEFMKTALAEQCNYLNKKIAVREKIEDAIKAGIDACCKEIPNISTEDTTSSNDNDSEKQINDLEILKNNMLGKAKDIAFLEQVNALLQNLENLEENSLAESIKDIQQRFIAVQLRQTGKIDQDFAEYLLHTAPKRYQSMSEIHIPTAEVHAFQLYNLFHGVTSPTPDVESATSALSNNNNIQSTLSSISFA